MAVGVVAIFLVVVFAVSKVGGSDTADTPLLGQAAPADHRPAARMAAASTSSTRRGSWVVLNFFASWCDPCKQEAAELARFASAQQSAGTAGAELVGIVYNDSADAIRSFLQTYGGGNFPVVLDQQGSNAITYGVVKVPETWIVDPSGIVRARVIVPVTADSLSDLLPAGAGGRVAVSFLRRWGPWLAMAVIVVVVLVVANGQSGPRTNAERIDGIAKTLKCPTCVGESVYTSQAASAQDIKEEIARQVGAGRSDDQIRAYFAERLGEQYLLTPSSSGIGSLTWVLPVVALVVAFGGLGFAFAEVAPPAGDAAARRRGPRPGGGRAGRPARRPRPAGRRRRPRSRRTAGSARAAAGEDRSPGSRPGPRRRAGGRAGVPADVARGPRPRGPRRRPRRRRRARAARRLHRPPRRRAARSSPARRRLGRRSRRGAGAASPPSPAGSRWWPSAPASPSPPSSGQRLPGASVSGDSRRLRERQAGRGPLAAGERSEVAPSTATTRC